MREVENRRVGRVLVTVVPDEPQEEAEVATLPGERGAEARDDKAS